MNASRIKGLYAIADKKWNKCSSLTELIEKYLLGGCKLVQLRMKSPSNDLNLWSDEVFDVAKDVMKFKNNFDFTFIINDYVDVAAEIHADGIHVGSNDMSITNVRDRVGKDMIIGYSSHSYDEAIKAEIEGADYVALGAVYPTKTKGYEHPVVGIHTLRKVSKTLNIPVVAIGGINKDNYKEVLGAGASAVAMISALTDANDITSETSWFVEQEL